MLAVNIPPQNERRNRASCAPGPRELSSKTAVTVLNSRGFGTQLLRFGVLLRRGICMLHTTLGNDCLINFPRKCILTR